MTPLEAVQIIEDAGGPTQWAETDCNGPEDYPAKYREAWQYLHDTGIAYQLQGWYGRVADQFVGEGIINS